MKSWFALQWRRLHWRINGKAPISRRAELKGWRNIEIGPGCKIHSGAVLDAARDGLIVLGEQVTINRLVYLQGGRGGIRLDAGAEAYSMLDGTGGIVVGARTLIGPGVRIISYQHRFVGRQPVKGQATDARPIVIENDVWIGANAVIMAGVRIGEGAIVGAGAVVTRDVPAWSVATGVPARTVRRREPAPENAERQ